MFRPVFYVFLAVLCGFAIAQGQESLTKPRTQYFPDTRDNIHLEMVFNYNVTDINTEVGVVDMVWASDYPNQPAGVYNTVYIPYSVDNFTHSVGWYRRNHPDWLEYLCDRKTLAFEFGATTLAPIDFANPAVQAYQWANWVDAPLAQGYAGIAVDTMSASANWGRCGHYDLSGNWVQQYTGKLHDPAYQSDELAWEAATYQHVHAFSKISNDAGECVVRVRILRSSEPATHDNHRSSVRRARVQQLRLSAERSDSASVGADRRRSAIRAEPRVFAT